MGSYALNLANVALTASPSSNATVTYFSGNLQAQSIDVQGAFAPANGLYEPANNVLGFTTNGTEQARITATGNLLIGGTTAASGANTRVLVNSTGTNGGGIQLAGGTAGGLALSALNGGGATISTYTGAIGSETYAERQRITSTGNLLINGTTAPSGGNAQVLINAIATNAGGLQLAGGTSGGGNVYGINGGGLVIGTYSGAVGSETYTERMRIDSTGNVGIATTSMSVRLQVSALSPAASATWAGGTDFMNLFSLPGSSYSEQSIAFQEAGSNIGAKIGVKNTQNGAMDIIFANRNTSSLTSTMTERMRIDSSGYMQGTVNGLGAGRIPAMQYYRLNSGVLGTQLLTAQNLLGVGVTLVGSMQYAFEAFYVLNKSTGVNSHTVSYQMGGTATYNNILYELFAVWGGTSVLSTSGNMREVISTSTAAIAVAGAVTTENYVTFRMTGTLSVNAGGTFIPQYILNADPGAAWTTLAGSYLRIYPLAASGTNVSIGTWA